MNFAERLLIQIFNLSLSASLVAVIVFALRLLLKKTPKIYSYILWVIVFVRFLCPFTIQSAINLIPIKNKTITYTDPFTERIIINSGIRGLDIAAHNAINSNAVLPVLKNNINFLELLLNASSVIWLIGMITILLIAVLRYIQLKKKLRTATRLNIGMCGGCEVFETDQIDSPFLMGLIKPKIYVPLGMNEQDLSYVLLHELIHRKRKDYIVKPFCFLAVVLHWLNPMVWVSFHMLVKDMEMSCDEAVIKKNKEDIRTKYSTALLQISMKQSGLFLPIAFGESSTKDRIKNILNFKKPAAWLGVWAVIILAAISIMFLTSEKAAEGNSDNNIVDNVKLSQVEKDSLEELIENLNPYIGDNIRYSRIIESKELENSLTKAIMDFNKLDYTNSIFKTEDHIILGDENRENSVTVYAMVLYQEYGYEAGEIKDIAGNHVPAAITFEIGKDGVYMLKEYWIPKDGSYYLPSIREKFPATIAKNAIDTQQYIKQQQDACDQKLQEFLQKLKKEVDEKKEEFQKRLEKSLNK